MRSRFGTTVRRSAITLMVAAFVFVSNASATLIDRGGGLIYDTDLNITWQANANVNGAMTWDGALTWASNLSFFDGVRNVSYDDWRLPAASGCNGFNCLDTEMGHLFYSELGGVALQSIATTHNTNYDLFQNVQATLPNDFGYWTATPVSSTFAWVFQFSTGNSAQGSKSFNRSAWAVRDGDVAAVPEPATLLLLSGGLAGLAAWRMRRQAHR